MPIPDATIQQIKQSPRLPQVVQQLQTLLADERKKRDYFYDVVSEQQKSEFINGEIIVHSPVKMRHSNASKLLLSLLEVYVREHDLGFVGHEKILITLTRNDYEPDICYFGLAKAQTFTPDQMKFPAPDLIVEVLSPSTEAIDRGIKFEDYAAHGVQEYWLVDPDEEVVEQYRLQGEGYELALKVKDGPIDSSVVSGFVIPVRAIFDERAQLAALREIVS